MKKRNAKAVLLIDDNEEDVKVLRKSVYNLAVLNRYDYDQLEEKIILEERHIVLISADTDCLAAVDIALFATTKPVSRVGVLSATNSLQAHLTDTPFSINGVSVFFSNGGEYGTLLADRERQENCDLCDGTGHIVFNSIAEDVCPRCGNTMRKGKDWMKFIQSVIIQGPTTFRIPIYL